jgi:AbrB family looped-hinge helix DNA binding protein
VAQQQCQSFYTTYGVQWGNERRANLMAKSIIWNIPFTVKVDERNRVQIPKDVAETAELKEGDSLSLVLTQVHRKEA